MLPITRPQLVKVGHYNHISVHPISGSIGAEIQGVDLNAVSPVQIDEIKRAFADHVVIVIRNQQTLTRENHIRFAESFGRLQPIPHVESRRDCAAIQIVHRDAHDERGVAGEFFHLDSTYMDTPPTVVVMRAIKIPPFGGDTAFANLYLAYESLSSAMQSMLGGLSVVHSAQRLFSGGAEQAGHALKGNSTMHGASEAVHPLVIKHPITGRKSILVDPAYCWRIDGMTEAESTPLLDFLYRHATFTRFTARVRWDTGTVVVWDNWAAYHSAIGDYQGYERTLERVTLGGGSPG